MCPGDDSTRTQEVRNLKRRRQILSEYRNGMWTHLEVGREGSTFHNSTPTFEPTANREFECGLYMRERGRDSRERGRERGRERPHSSL